MSKANGLRAFMYVRISDDRMQGAGVERQTVDGTKLAKRKGAKIVATFNDNDRSATKGVRPQYQAMLKRIAAGECDIVIAYSQERLWRDELEHPLFMRMAREVGVRVFLVNGGEVNPNDANDSMVSTILNAVAVYETASTRRRVNRELADRRAAGKYLGGGRAFGHNADRTALEPDEAAAVVDAVKRITEGESASVLIKEWNAAGITSVNGKPWVMPTFLALMRQPRIAGLTPVNGNKHTRRRDGVEAELVPAAWPAIVDVDVWRECVRALKVRNARRGAPAKRHWLTGNVLRCGRCNSPMHAGWQSQRGKRWHSYVCPAATTTVGACGRCCVDGERTEAIVLGKVFDRLNTREFAAAVKRAQKAKGNQRYADAVKALDKKRARLRDVERMFTSGDIDPAAFKRMRGELLPEVEKLEREVAEAQGEGAGVIPVHLAGRADELRADWEAMTVDERRDVLAMLVERVVIHPVAYKGARWNPDRVEVFLRY